MESVAYVLLCGVLAALGLTLALRIKRRKKSRKRLWVRPWLKRRDDPKQKTMVHLYKELLRDGDVTEFSATLRMHPRTYAALLDILREGLTKRHTNFRKPIAAETRLAVTLRFLALADGFRSLSQQYRIGLSTVRLIVRETCRLIYKTMQSKYMKTPNTRDEWLTIASEFNTHWQFPHCLGAVDRKHIRIVQPVNSGSYFYNYKGYFSIVLMAIVNADYRFLFLDIGAEGKASDGGIWQQCTFHQYLSDPTNPLNIPEPQKISTIDKNIPYFLVADDAFRLGEHIMKPYKGKTTRKEHIFNYRLSRSRRIVENTFGILSCRFRVFHRTLEVNPEYVQDIVLACCTLHNFLRDTARSDYMPSIAIDNELPDGDVIPGAWREEGDLDSLRVTSQRNAAEYAKNIRNSLATYFLTPAGELPWQYRRCLE